MRDESQHEVQWGVGGFDESQHGVQCGVGGFDESQHGVQWGVGGFDESQHGVQWGVGGFDESQHGLEDQKNNHGTDEKGEEGVFPEAEWLGKRRKSQLQRINCCL